jgi:hypothetical protein
MAQYFFDIIADGKLSPDEEGMILPNMDAARREASRSLADLARDNSYSAPSQVDNLGAQFRGAGVRSKLPVGFRGRQALKMVRRRRIREDLDSSPDRAALSIVAYRRDCNDSAGRVPCKTR